MVGTALLRQYAYAAGPLLPDGASAAVVTADADEARRSPADLAVLGDPGSGRPVAHRPGDANARHAATEPFERPARRRQVPRRHGLRRDRPPAGPDAVVVEETPSTRPILEDVIATRRPLGFVSAAMGGLGFALPAAIGLRMAMPDRPVVAVVGDGSSLYSIQSLWTAVDQRVGALFVVLANGRYAVMDRLAEGHGGKAPWPAFPEVSVERPGPVAGVPERHVSTTSRRSRHELSTIRSVGRAVADRGGRAGRGGVLALMPGSALEDERDALTDADAQAATTPSPPGARQLVRDGPGDPGPGAARAGGRGRSRRPTGSPDRRRGRATGAGRPATGRRTPR